MQLPQNAAPMPAEQRAELRKSALAATPGPWEREYDNDTGAFDDYFVEWQAAGPAELRGGGKQAEADANYIAAIPPDVALATLAYVEALEAEVARLTDNTVSVEVYAEATKIHQELLAAATARATKAEAENARLVEQLTPGSPTERAPTTWAYEQACKAIETHRARTGELQAELAEREVMRFGELQDLDTARAALSQAATALADSYDMTEWPGPGKSSQEEAHKAVLDALNKLNSAPSPPPISPAAAAVAFQPVAPTGCKCGFIKSILGDGCEKCNPECHEDEREVIGRYETTGLPVYEGDDYALDVEGIYLTREEANALIAEQSPAGPPTTGEGGSAL